ncbi:hypothetical protein BMS3Bbin15_01698 [archaeon BMS3Bbin15]|nr:hypothetical protein BMS3Bbin15_01698 [archaeon BMS3Bbin15]
MRTTPVIISGLFRDTRQRGDMTPYKTLAEIKSCLKLNPQYGEELIFFAADDWCAKKLSSLGLYVEKIMDDAPQIARIEANTRMKFWMCNWALEEFGEYLWVDWDAICLKWPDNQFWKTVRKSGNPKFTYIRNYWARVNCAVHYASSKLGDLREYVGIPLEEPNDELIWMKILSEKGIFDDDIWLNEMTVNIWLEKDLDLITPNTYFAHVRNVELGEHSIQKYREVVTQ